MSYCKYPVRPSPYQFSQPSEQSQYIKMSGRKIESRLPININGNSINVRDITNTNYLGFDQIFVIPEDKRIKYTHPKETIATSKL